MKTIKNIINRLIVTMCLYTLVIVVPIIGLARTQSPAMRRTMAQMTIKKRQMKQSDQTILTGHPEEVTYCTLSDNGKILATSSKGTQNNLILWNGQTGEKLHVLSVEAGNITFLQVSPDGSRVVAQSDDQENTNSTLTLWDTSTGKQIKTLEHPSGSVINLEFSFDGKAIVYSIINSDEKVYLFIVDSASGNKKTDNLLETQSYFTLNPKNASVLVWSAHDFTVYSLESFKKIGTLKLPIMFSYNKDINTNGVHVFYSTDGTKILLNTDFFTYIFDEKTGKLLKELYTGPIPANQNQWTSDGTKTVLYKYKHFSKIVVYDIITDSDITTITTPAPRAGFSLAFSPDNTIFSLLGSFDNFIDIFDTTTGQKLHTLSGQPSIKSSDITFSSDNKRIETHSHDDQNNCIIYLWDITSTRLINTFVGTGNLYHTSKDLLTIISPDTTNNHNFVFKKLSKEPLRYPMAKFASQLPQTPMPPAPYPVEMPQIKFLRSETELARAKFVQPAAPTQTLRQRMYNTLRSAFGW